MEVELGQLVRSIAGRDAGRWYLVLRRLDDIYVLVSDGDKRSVVNPKKKNIRHLALNAGVAKELQARLERNEPVSDVEIRAAIEELRSRSEEKEVD